MALRAKYSQKRFAGISDFLKEDSNPDAFFFARGINYRKDPQSVTLMPGAVKESASVVIDLIKWGAVIPDASNYYFYGNAGNIYNRTSAGVWTNLHTAPSSHGNGLAYFTGDDYLYYTEDSTIGRYGTVVGGGKQFNDDFLKAAGGVPTNTYSLAVAAASSMYATAANSASLQITGNLTLEAYFKATTVPAIGSSMTLVGKWDESGATRGYKLDLYGVSGYFGSGSDGALTISVNTTEAPIDSACTGTAGTTTLTATNASFAANQVILIHQTQGTSAGQWERNTIQGYTAGTITLGTSLIGTYTTGAQVRVLKQYTNVTINSGKTYTAKAWNGTVGGILGFLANGTVTGTGNILADGKGFNLSSGAHYQGESNLGLGTTAATNNGNGGEGGQGTSNDRNAGAGGSNGTQGGGGGSVGADSASIPGSTTGSADLTTAVFGGQGGSNPQGSATGGAGGGFIFIIGATLTITGAITANGANGSAASGNDDGSGGGAGGSILLKAQTATLGSSLITATGGSAGTSNSLAGGIGGVGRIHLDYLTSYTGTTNPTLTATQDGTLVTTATTQARLGISNDGTAFEYLTQNLTTLTTGNWNRLSVAWTASTSTALFYLNGTLVGTSVGTKTTISSNVSLLYIGANKTSVVANFFDGKVDDIRVWSNVQTAAQILANNNLQLTGGEGGLQAYYSLNNSANDVTANANNLTLVNTPTYSTDVPFSGATTRLDIDSSSTGASTNTYTLLTAIGEGGSDQMAFTPVSDPQKSMSFQVDTVGTGNWTLTVHDQQNNVIATSTVNNANIVSSTNFQEFIFATPWRIIIGKTYHCHLTVSTGTSKVRVVTSGNFSTAYYYDYFGFLVTDTAYHPITQFLNFLAIGNERYIAYWDGAAYHPNYITFPPGWRVRCFGFWREYLAIAVWRGTNIYDYAWGRVYFWDGISPTFNFYIDTGDGQVNALFGMDSDLYMMVGYRGFLYDYQGGFFYNTGNTKTNKLKRVPNNYYFSDTDSVEIYPGAFTMWRNLLYIGMMGAGTSTNIQRGAYSYGSYNQNYKDTLSLDFPISTGNYGSTVTIGCIYPAGKQMIVGWQDGIAYGADVIDYANNPYNNGTMELLVQDDGVIWKEKSQLTLRADYLALNSGESVKIKYKVDRASTFTLATADTTVGSKSSEFNIDSTIGRGREYQLAVDISATGTTSPTLIGLSLLGDSMEEEQQF